MKAWRRVARRRRSDERFYRCRLGFWIGCRRTAAQAKRIAGDAEGWPAAANPLTGNFSHQNNSLALAVRTDATVY